MQSTRKRGRPQVHADDYAIDHPFIRWYASYSRAEAASYSERGGADGLAGDIFMGEMASSRFSIGASDDRVPELGIAQADAEAVMSMPWASAAFLRRVQRRDWVALSCPDARMPGSGTVDKVPLRLWLPATMGLLDGWINATPAPTLLRIVPISIRKGAPEPVAGQPLATLPLAFKGAWEAEAPRLAGPPMEPDTQ